MIDVAKKYFGIRETSKVRLIENDGRVFLNRHKETYDLIFIDAFTGSYIPFHLMTKEFYRLVQDRLAPNGVAAFNFLPGTKLLRQQYPHIEGRVRSCRSLSCRRRLREVIAMAPRDPVADPETLKQQADAVQERYKFRFDVAKLAVAERE